MRLISKSWWSRRAATARKETMSQEDEPSSIIVLYNQSTKLVRGQQRDLLADEGVIACAQAVADALRAAGYRVAQVPIHTNVEQALAPYPSTRWVIFNLGEGLGGRLFEEARIAWALEAMGYRFTGASGEALARSSHKARTKSILAANGVTTPPWWVFYHSREVNARVAAALPFPLIVKPVAEDASIGVDADAVVHTRQALRSRVTYIVKHYRQAAMAEAFITGREFNIGLWGDPPEMLPLAEVDFSAITDPFSQVITYAAKWEADSFEYNNTPVVCPAVVDSELSARIVSTVRRAWTAIGCRGYARVDMRVSNDGVPYVLEVNCNPDISPDAGFFRAAQVAGYSYQDMAVHILKLAGGASYVADRAGLGYRRSGHPANNGRDQHLHTHRQGVRRRVMEFVPG
jgi:D-alanine-D-alanine ligase